MTTKKKHLSLAQLDEMKKLLRSAGLNTVCESAQCPNRGECFERGTATFLIMGDTCTRSCRFCAIKKGVPRALDKNEPLRIASIIDELKLKYIVITSVTRDDLPDGGAQHFVDTIRAIRQSNPTVKIEVLTSDFNGNHDASSLVIKARPDVFNHNLETVPRLYEVIRPKAEYLRSLELISRAKKAGLGTKSGLMLGMGEFKYEVQSVMDDLVKAGCDTLTLGQYLSPSKNHVPVQSYLSDSEFNDFRADALSRGFKQCASAPYVRSSYRAEELYKGKKH